MLCSLLTQIIRCVGGISAQFQQQDGSCSVHWLFHWETRCGASRRGQRERQNDMRVLYRRRHQLEGQTSYGLSALHLLTGSSCSSRGLRRSDPRFVEDGPSVDLVSQGFQDDLDIIGKAGRRVAVGPATVVFHILGEIPMEERDGGRMPAERTVSVRRLL
jgi:hypothetical protein